MFTKIPFGLKGTPQSIQRAKVVILASVSGQFPLVYLDDIAEFSKSPEDHIEQEKSVLRLLCKAAVTLKPKKCKLFAEIIYYLDRATRPGRLELAEHTTGTFAKLQKSTK